MCRPSRRSTGSCRSARPPRSKRDSASAWSARWMSSTRRGMWVTTRRKRCRHRRQSGWRSSSSSSRGRIATARKYAPAARDYALFRTLYHAGLRSDEASMLELPDLHFGRGPFGKLHVRFGKGARMSGPRPRWVPMLDSLDLVLRWFVDDVRGRFPDSPVLFADESGGRLHRGTIRNRLRRLMQLEGRPEGDWFSPHALRRACATHNYERGVDLVAIQQLLGHWTVSSTMRYVRPSTTFIEDAYRRAVSSTLAELTGEGPAT
ncbi:site-specific integrase [Actinoplanes sp. NPDC051411]|uniref:tyrosine-type recombinase/integrase n=1 Tax=Actinoplanes sp. NPDC051411 TaxID=3155522 RepID=UPI003427A2C1